MTAAIRLSFAYEDGKLVLTGARRVQMRVPPPSRIDRFDECAGAWIELQDPKGKPLYRRAVSRSALSDDVEIQTGDPEQPLRWQKTERKTGTFHAIVPDLPEAATFVLMQREYERKQGARGAAAGTRELVRVDLKKLDRDRERRR